MPAAARLGRPALHGRRRALDIADTKGFEPLFRPDRGAPRASRRSASWPSPAAPTRCTSPSGRVVGPGDEAVARDPHLRAPPADPRGPRRPPRIRVARGGRDRASACRSTTSRGPSRRGTRAILLTSPHNPSGRLLSAGAIDGLARLAADRGPPRRRRRGLPRLPSARARRPYPSLAAVSDRFVVAGSLTKAHGLSGLRLGWIAGPPDVIAEAWRWQEILADRVPALDAQAACVAFDHMAALQAARVGRVRARASRRCARGRRRRSSRSSTRAPASRALVQLPAGVDSKALANEALRDAPRPRAARRDVRHPGLAPDLVRDRRRDARARASTSSPPRSGRALAKSGIATRRPPPPRSRGAACRSRARAPRRPRTRGAPARSRPDGVRASRGSGRTAS